MRTKTNLYEYSASFLLEAIVDGDMITFVLDEHSMVSKNDKIYILVRYPNSNYKYIVYSMNGITYLSNKTISSDTALIEGFNNIDLLEKIDDKYYAYAMVIKEQGDATPAEEKKADFMPIVWGVVIATPLLLWLIIKIRRRVRSI